MRILLGILLTILLATPCCGNGHNRLVAQSGINPRQVGSFEGVGSSSISREEAIRQACRPKGKQQILSIQTSYRNGRHYAVVRYR